MVLRALNVFPHSVLQGPSRLCIPDATIGGAEESAPAAKAGEGRGVPESWIAAGGIRKDLSRVHLLVQSAISNIHSNLINPRPKKRSNYFDYTDQSLGRPARSLPRSFCISTGKIAHLVVFRYELQTGQSHGPLKRRAGSDRKKERCLSERCLR